MQTNTKILYGRNISTLSVLNLNRDVRIFDGICIEILQEKEKEPNKNIKHTNEQMIMSSTNDEHKPNGWNGMDWNRMESNQIESNEMDFIS